MALFEFIDLNGLEIFKEEQDSQNAGLFADHLSISQNATTGVVTIQLYSKDNTLLDTKTLDLDTEHIIKSATLNYAQKKLVFTMNDDSTIECDITTIVDKITTIENKIPIEASSQNQLADKEWVNNNGGKIDTISINGVNQQVVNKNVDLPAYPTRESLSIDNVDNTSDLAKPVSTAQQNALDLKENLSNKVKSTDGWGQTPSDDKYTSEKIVKEALDLINGKIPTQASSSNQLADKEFVNSSISTATATFRGTYNLVSDLGLSTIATEQEIASAIATKLSSLSIVADNNDYVFIQIPTSSLTPTQIARVDRYKYNGTTWGYEFSLNNSGFTADQWEAINSGITSTLVSDINSNTSARHTHSNKALLDTYTQTEEDLADAVDKKHSHSNKAVLDDISSTDVSNWNGKQDEISDLETIRSGASAGATAVQDNNYVHTDNNYTTTEKNKLSGIEANAEVNAIEKIKVDNVEQTIDSTDRSVNIDLSGKVDKVQGKQLSTEDYTTAEKNKLAGIEAGAEVNDVTSVNTKTGAVVLDSDDISDTNKTHKFVTASEKTQITTNKNDITNIKDGTNIDSFGDVETALSGKQPTIDSSHKVSADLIDDTSTTNKFVTTSEKTTWNGKQNALTFDDTPTQNSSNPVKSGGVYSALSGKEPTISLTTNRALVSDSNGKVGTSSVTNTELGYLSGVTSNVQTQINNVVTVASGKNKAYVTNKTRMSALNSQNDSVSITSFVDKDGTTIATSNFNVGDIVYLTDTEIPDRWVGAKSTSGSTTTLTLYKMETSKVDLSSYVTNVSYDSSSKKIQQTKNGVTTDVLTLGDSATKNVGTTSGTVCAGDDSRLSNKREPTSHASSGTGYGVGTTSNYGHVKLATGDMNGATDVDGVACSKNHTHSQYLTSHQSIKTINGNTMTGTGNITTPNDNTWRKVQLNGVDKLGTGTGTNPLNIKAGSNMTITESNGTFEFSASGGGGGEPIICYYNIATAYIDCRNLYNALKTVGYGNDSNCRYCYFPFANLTASQQEKLCDIFSRTTIIAYKNYTNNDARNTDSFIFNNLTITMNNDNEYWGTYIYGETRLFDKKYTISIYVGDDDEYYLSVADHETDNNAPSVYFNEWGAHLYEHTICLRVDYLNENLWYYFKILDTNAQQITNNNIFTRWPDTMTHFLNEYDNLTVINNKIIYGANPANGIGDFYAYLPSQKEGEEIAFGDVDNIYVTSDNVRTIF